MVRRLNRTGKASPMHDHFRIIALDHSSLSSSTIGGLRRSVEEAVARPVDSGHSARPCWDISSAEQRHPANVSANVGMLHIYGADTDRGQLVFHANALPTDIDPLWLLEPVDGPGGETKSKTCVLTPGPGGDLLEDLVPPTSSTIQDRCHQVLEYRILAPFTGSGDWLSVLSAGSFYCIRDPLSVTYML